MRHKGKMIICLIGVVYSIVIIGYHYAKPITHQNVEITSKQPVVLTSFYPMYMHAKALTKDTGLQVVNLTEKQVGCLHDYHLSVKDMQKIQQADILVANGLGAENFMDKAYAQNPNLQVINASETIEQKLQEQEHHHEEKDIEHEQHGGHHHEFNEHIWVSIDGSIEQVKTISLRLQELDPNHKMVYIRNEKDYVNQLNALKIQMHTELQKLSNTPIVTTHSTFDYFAKEFGLEIASEILQHEQGTPTPKEIERIVETMKNNSIHVIFTEKQYEHLSIVRTIAKETNSKVYFLDSFVSQDDEDQSFGDNYISRMKTNLEVLKEAYGL